MQNLFQMNERVMRYAEISQVIRKAYFNKLFNVLFKSLSVILLSTSICLNIVSSSSVIPILLLIIVLLLLLLLLLVLTLLFLFF